MASMIAPEIFEHLKTRMEEDTKTKDDLTQVVQKLEREVAYTQGLLSRVHSTHRAQYSKLLFQVEDSIWKQREVVAELNELASKHSYYKYNYKWTRVIQDAVFTALLDSWLGGARFVEPKLGKLLTLEEVGHLYNVPTNLKDKDAFHITIEEYLFAIINLVDELPRLAINSVTLGDNELAVKISAFVKDIYAGFSLLNLKNDALRKRVDSVKYAVKKVEDITYDLSLRNLIPAAGSTSI